jgi:CRISPR-associated protein Csd1
MSWIQKLYETYELCADAPQFARDPPEPVSHTLTTTHVEIVLDQDGTFLRAVLLDREPTVVPATERSRLRTGTNPPPHPLCDKIRCCASDYKAFGGRKKAFFEEYIKQLRQWQARDVNTKVHAVLGYVEKGGVVADLVRVGILYCDANGKLLTEWASDHPTPQLFKMLSPDKHNKRDQGDAVVRWRVQVSGDPVSALWEDPDIRDSWISLDTSRDARRGLCIVTGEISPLAVKHPNGVRHRADMAKLISSDDRSGYTYRGRVDLPTQACGIGSAVTQKAHSALRWLIKRQGYQVDEQVFVAWASSGDSIPDPFADTASLLETAEVRGIIEPDIPYEGDAGQHFALRLRKAISGYRAKLVDADGVVVIGLDSATKGRMAVTFYRELSGSEFLDRVSAWHSACAWLQRSQEGKRYVGAPAPREVAEATYGRRIDGKLRIDEKLRKAAVARLVPCIVDARPLPRDIVATSVRRAINRAGFEKEKGVEADWEKCLGIACALVRGSEKEENYKMSLEEDRTTRDYLFGRLLAIAENIEERALHLAGEKRETNSAKLMHRFADHPCSAWRSIELALIPYKTRLRTNRPAVLLERDKLLDAVIGMFSGEDFISDSRLSGEFLLGYHCQRAALWPKGKPDGGSPEKDESTIQGEEV